LKTEDPSAPTSSPLSTYGEPPSPPSESDDSSDWDASIGHRPPPGLEGFGRFIAPASIQKDFEKEWADERETTDEEDSSLLQEKDELAKQVQRMQAEILHLTKAAMAGTWTYGAKPFQIEMSEDGELHFCQEVAEGLMKGKRASWRLVQCGDWLGCELEAKTGASHGSVQFRLDASRTGLLVRMRPSPADGFKFTRTARRVVVQRDSQSLACAQVITPQQQLISCA
jgi:hypothetical protein